jgi:hypothetical protein
MTFYDARSSDSSDPPSTPEQRTRIKRPKPDDDDLRSLGSYTKTKPIPKKDKVIEELRLQHQFEIKSLRAEMDRMKAEQRRMQSDVNSVRTLSTYSKAAGSGNDLTEAEKLARRSIPAEIFYGITPTNTSPNPDPMTMSELRAPTPVDD